MNVSYQNFNSLNIDYVISLKSPTTDGTNQTTLYTWMVEFPAKIIPSKKEKRKRVLPFLQQHQGFQYHQEVPENRRLPGVLRDLWDQGDLVDPVGNKQSHLSLRNGIHLHAPCSVKVLNDNTVRMRTN